MSNNPSNNVTSAGNRPEGNEASLLRLIKVKKWDAALERLETHEEEAKVADSNGWFPLHWACLFNAPGTFIREILMVFPEANEARFDNGWGLPLHCLFVGYTEGVDEAIVDLLIQANPAAASTRDNIGQTPLHMAARNRKLSLPPLQSLLAANPEAASVVDEWGYLPLHHACHYWTSGDNENPCEMLEKLFMANPNAASTKDGDGVLPIHNMMGNEWIYVSQKGMETFNLIFKANTDAASAPYADGDLLLHRICRTLEGGCLNDCSFEIFSSIIDAYPRAASIPDGDNELPLHIATKRWPLACDRFLSMLVAANPGALHIHDNNGHTPIDNSVNRESDANEFVSKLFSLSSTGALLSQMGELNVTLAMAMRRANSLEGRNQSLEARNQSLEARNQSLEACNQSLEEQNHTLGRLLANMTRLVGSFFREN